MKGSRFQGQQGAWGDTKGQWMLSQEALSAVGHARPARQRASLRTAHSGLGAGGLDACAG